MSDGKFLVLEKSPHGGSGGTCSNVCTDFSWVEVVIDKSVNDGWEIVLDESLAESLKTGIDPSKGSAKLKYSKL